MCVCVCVGGGGVLCVWCVLCVTHRVHPVLPGLVGREEREKLADQLWVVLAVRDEVLDQLLLQLGLLRYLVREVSECECVWACAFLG